MKRVAKVEGPVVPASGVYTALDVAGDGYIDLIAMSIATGDYGRMYSRLRVYVDGETQPSIDVRMRELSCSCGMDGRNGNDPGSACYTGMLTAFTSRANWYGAGLNAYLM